MRRFYDTIPTVIFMTDITVIHVGNIKDSFFDEALSEYKKRMAAFCRFREIEIKEEKCDLPSEVDKCLAKEADKILAALPKKGFRVALCVEGKQMSSEDFALLNGRNAAEGVTYVIGSSYGLAESVKAACDMRLSFSKMTLPHRLMRVVLYEQIYRAFTIINGRKYLMAFDSFKGTLTSLEAGNIARDAAQAVGYDSEVQVVSDGGEGLVDAFVYSNPAKLLEVCTVDPLFREMKADFAISDETAVIECASAAGLCLVPEEKRDPKVTTTFGVGLMIKAAVENGARKIILGLGGSATNDGGTGMAAALGAVFRDHDG